MHALKRGIASDAMRFITQSSQIIWTPPGALAVYARAVCTYVRTCRVCVRTHVPCVHPLYYKKFIIIWRIFLYRDVHIHINLYIHWVVEQLNRNSTKISTLKSYWKLKRKGELGDDERKVTHFRGALGLKVITIWSLISRRSRMRGGLEAGFLGLGWFWLGSFVEAKKKVSKREARSSRCRW